MEVPEAIGDGREELEERVIQLTHLAYLCHYTSSRHVLYI